jgi:hypothetical protein
MNHVASLFFVVVAVAATAAHADTCLDPAKAKTEAAAAEARNATRLEAALKKQGLAMANLKPAASNDTELAGKQLTRGNIITLKREGKDVRILVGPRMYDSCHSKAQWELVKNTKGEVFGLVRRPKPTGGRTAISMCGCDDYAYRCGGAAPREVLLLFEMPDGATYNGDVEVEYVEDPTRLSFNNVPPKGKTCPPPPPPTK